MPSPLESRWLVKTGGMAFIAAVPSGWLKSSIFLELSHTGHAVRHFKGPMIYMGKLGGTAGNNLSSYNYLYGI